MESYLGCQGLLVSLTEQSECGTSVSVRKRTRFPGGVTLRCLFRFFPALGDLVLDLSAAGRCSPFAGLCVRGRQL